MNVTDPAQRRRHNAAMMQAERARARYEITETCPVCKLVIGLDEQGEILPHVTRGSRRCKGGGRYHMSVKHLPVACTPQAHELAAARGRLAEAAVGEAERLIQYVHGDGDRMSIGLQLSRLDRDEMHALAVVLAAMCDPRRSAEQALSWVNWDEHGQHLEPPGE